MKIVPFKEEYQTHFYDLNIEWLQAYFYVEPYDETVLRNSKQYIIDKGGHIFFAKKDSNILGTVALMATQKKTDFELAKMAVNPRHRGKKIGQKLMQHCIRFSKDQGYSKLILYSSTLLENAIHIYKKYGFNEIPVEDNCHYKRCNIKMELTL